VSPLEYSEMRFHSRPFALLSLLSSLALGRPSLSLSLLTLGLS
jgi:hypothetical protein